MYPCELEFFRALALCHTVVPSDNFDANNECVYRAASPDEEALVKAARSIGVEFVQRERKSVAIDIVDYNLSAQQQQEAQQQQQTG